MNARQVARKTAIGPRRHALIVTLMFGTLLSAAYARVATIRSPAPHDILKNRYITIDPRGAGQTNPASHHILVMVECSLVSGHAPYISVVHQEETRGRTGLDRLQCPAPDRLSEHRLGERQ